MKIIVTHVSPDLDAIAAVWLVKRFWQGWEDAGVRFVPAGERVQRLASSKIVSSSERKKIDVVEQINGNDVIHVDTGLGAFDHHDTSDNTISAASLVWNYIKKVESGKLVESSERVQYKHEAIDRMVKVVVDIDHFKDVFWEDPTGDYHEFSITEVLNGLKLQKPNLDNFYVDFIMECLDSILHNFENRIWAEREIKENGMEFNTRFGKGIAFETINDSVVKLSQKMGYVVAVRKDPRKGYVRIKARPSQVQSEGIDLTLVYEKLKKMDPDATWFLHVSKKMLLNGSAKNPKMRPTKLSLSDIIKVLENV
ncbi:MAG: hypothetical protein Q8P80_01450 [Candidatus Levybacteria bacterium]|nr:hypothetical protein [Candidatus Levybacteria bacterium]